jgi:ABC-type Zn uptake system ZnuABC Zn-binding protein ZnuA
VRPGIAAALTGNTAAGIGAVVDNEFQYDLAMRRTLALSSSLLAACCFLAACGDDDRAGAPGPDRLRVAATTTQAADLARSVGGERVEVVGLLTPNADPHAYEPRPRDIRALADAQLIVRSGGELDEWLAEAIESSGADAPVVSLIDSVKTIKGGAHHHDEAGHAGDEGHHEEDEHAEEGGHADEQEETDPHWWQDPRNGALAATALGAALAKADPQRAADYRAGATDYVQRLRALDTAIAECWQKVPQAQHKLVTTHDALGYYARRYGLEVIGTVIPSLSTAGQASAGETAELVELIEHEKVRAIFAESSVNTKVERAIARETGAKIGRPLWADSLGPPSSGGATYLESLAANTRSMVDGLGRGAVSCTLPA